MKPQVVSNKELKSFLEASKRETRLVGALEKATLMRPFDDRKMDVLHPSELIKKDWCALAAYHALRGNYIETRQKPTLRLRSIFDEGHAIHHKWQTWISEMGHLYGVWEIGKVRTWDTSINLVGAPSKVYKEVPLQSEKHMIYGHADGWVKGLGNDFLIEIKSIGAGTIRMEDPSLFNGSQDLEAAWRNIRRPFNTHFLQGQMYLHLCHLMVEEGLLESAPKEIVFLYELKANQDYKEFVVAYAPEYVEPFFKNALDVVWSTKNDRPPMCSVDSVKGCDRCRPHRGE